MKEIKLKIDGKDANTHTYDAFVHDLSSQLKEAPGESFKT